MVIGKIKPGSGAGDQLFSYICTRVAALDRGYDFGFVGIEHFKCKSFMSLDWGKPVDLNYKIIPESGDLILEDESKTFVVNTPYYNPEINFIPEDSIIDGYGAQDIRYFEHRLDEVREWLKVEPLEMLDDTCVINFRGGEYVSVPELFLPADYWDIAIKKIDNGKTNFCIHTDDPILAKHFFPDDCIHKDIALNWRSIRYAKHLIISNSAFAILPALLNEDAKEVIAPKFWAGRNVGEWRRPGNYYKKFTYI